MGVELWVGGSQDCGVAGVSRGGGAAGVPMQAEVENSCFATGVDWGILDTLQEQGHGTALGDLRLSCIHTCTFTCTHRHTPALTQINTHTQGRMKKSKHAGSVGVTEGF